MSALQTERKTGRPAGRTRVETLEIRARIVDLARQGYSERSIASEIGFSPSAIHQHLAEYKATLVPSSELAEEWRQTRIARAAERFRRLSPLALADPPDLQALQALQREEESITKMLGANLETGLSIGLNFTAEGMAAVFGWDDSAAVIDVEAIVEVARDADA